MLVSCPVHDELLAAQMFGSLPVPAQAVGRFALFVAEVQALSFAVDEDDRNVAAVLLAVGAHDVLGALISVTVVVRVASAGHLGGCDNGAVCVIVRDEGLRGLPGARRRTVFGVASIRKRTKKDGSSSYVVLWRDPKSREQQGLTVASLTEAETLKRLLDANGQSFEIAQHAILTNEKRPPTVAEVIQEHIDLLVCPSTGTVNTYQTMLELHIRTVIGHVPVDKLDYRLIAHWVKSMMAKGLAPKTIHNVHGLISAS